MRRKKKLADNFKDVSLAKLVHISSDYRRRCEEKSAQASIDQIDKQLSHELLKPISEDTAINTQ